MKKNTLKYFCITCFETYRISEYREYQEYNRISTKAASIYPKKKTITLPLNFREEDWKPNFSVTYLWW